MEPEMYWVVGPNTDVGKTTLAVAVISVLGGAGRKTVGFKPYGARKFVDIIDLDYRGLPEGISKVFGQDAVRLASVSNVTSLDDIDLIAPVASICYPEYRNVLVVRAGSRITRNAEFFKGRSAVQLEKRADYKRILEELGVQDWLDFKETGVSFPDVPLLGRSKVEDCYRHLLKTKDIDTVVCEGAGKFLPFWGEKRVVNHIFLIQRNEIYFFKDINLKIDLDASKLLPVQNILKVLRQKTHRKAFLPFSRMQMHDTVAREAVEGLLRNTL